MHDVEPIPLDSCNWTLDAVIELSHPEVIEDFGEDIEGDCGENSRYVERMRRLDVEVRCDSGNRSNKWGRESRCAETRH